MSERPEDLERLRIEAGLSSQQAAARDLGVNPRTYRRWANGEQDIPPIAFRCLRYRAELKKMSEKYHFPLAL